MTEEQSRLIASLKGDPAFSALLNHLEEEVGGMLGALEEASTPQEVLRLTRLWQIARKLLNQMRLLPSSLQEAIDKARDLPDLEISPGLYPEEDPFLRPRRPIAPTSQLMNSL